MHACTVLQVCVCVGAIETKGRGQRENARVNNLFNFRKRESGAGIV